MLLHPTVAMMHFDRLIRIFREASSTAQSWRLVGFKFPQVRLHLVGQSGVSLVGLVINGENWPYRAPAFIPMDIDFQGEVASGKIKARIEEGGFPHFFNVSGRLRFCKSGTDEFHRAYPKAMPWESVWKDPSSNPIRVVERIAESIALDEMNAIQPRGRPDA